jgi:hypothetical protein
LDLYNNFNANPFGSPTYTTSYLGTGAALELTRTSSQYAADIYTLLLFNSTSFTIEVWIYPISLTTDDYGIFGQCQANATNLCMFFIVRNLKLYCGFTNNDITGNTTITMNIWSHVACVYDLDSMTQQVWLNGVLDGSCSSPAYQGSLADTTIGVTYVTPSGSNFFNGYLDQMRFSLRAKNSTEILNDASLVVYYSFDGGSVYDNGPNGINATQTGTVTTVSGRVNQAVHLNSSSDSYISPSYRAFYMMGVSNKPFTIALWVQPTDTLAASTIVFVSSSPSGWCVGYITTQSNGQIIVNLWNGASTGSVLGPILSLDTWTHIGYTYSYTNGIQLYINGTLYSTSGTFSCSGSGTPNYVTIGSNLGQNYCAPFYYGFFNGAVDEFYLYCRELTAAEIWALANP